MTAYGVSFAIKMDEIGYQLRTAEMMANDIAGMAAVADVDTKEQQIKTIEYLKSVVSNINENLDKAIETIANK